MKKVFVLFTLAAFLFPVFAAETAGQVRTPVKTSPNVQHFLKQVESAKSVNEFKKAINDTRFSQQELAQLREEVKKPAVSEKLKRLMQEDYASYKSRMDARSLSLTRTREAEHKQRQESELKQMNGRTIAKLQNLKETKPAMVRAARPKAPSGASGMAQSQTVRPAVSSAGVIRSLTPGVATTGKSLTISGSDFGTRSGRVVIGIDRDRMDCPISSWSDRSIVVTVPEEFQPVVGMQDKVGFVWVKLHGSENGPFKNLTIRPDIEGMTPQITSLSTTELKPGAILLIEGENFYTEPRGTVEFRFGNKAIDGQITEWQDRYIAVYMHGSTRGLPRTDGTVVVRNHLNLQTVKSVTFVPNLTTVTRVYAREAWAIVVGYKAEHDDFSIRLKNGWTVKDNYLESDGWSPWWTGHGCIFSTKATPGAIHALSRTLIWVDFLGNVICTNFLVLEGPAGLEP